MKEIIEEMKKAFMKENANKLKRISNESLDKAVLSGDKVLVVISLVSYALYKILTKRHYQRSPGWEKFSQTVMEHLDLCIQNPGETEEILTEKLVQNISSMSIQHGRFMGDLIDKARVKQASRAYALGLSLSSAIDLTGADRFRVYTYIGMTKIHEDVPSKGVAERYDYAKGVLGG